MADLKSLISKLEKAKKGSRNLDIDVAKHLGWTWPHHDNAGNQVWKRSDGTFHYSAHPPKFTTSLDDAMTMVLEKWAVRITEDLSETSRTRGYVWWAELIPRFQWPDDKDWPHTLSGAWLLPLALNIASLKAIDYSCHQTR